MQLKDSHRKSWTLIVYENIWQDNMRRLWIILLYTLLIFGVGYLVHRSGFSFGQKLRPLREDINRMPKRINAILSAPEVDRITIDIRHEDYMRLAYQREQALKTGILILGDEDYVPATINHNGQTVDVKIRLKGDWTDHLQGDKWSFRIKVKDDLTLFGMRQFSIQHPKTRNYIYEWIFHQVLKREGVLALRYQFIHVTLNGKDLGVYALEEHFEKRLVENNRLREGPIVRFNEDLLWEERVQLLPFKNVAGLGYGSLRSVEIDAFQTNAMTSDATRYDQVTTAIQLLEAFRRGDLSRSEVFDVQKLAKFLAISDLMGAHHGLDWQNVRFYYNPITSRLEPIGFDGYAGRPIDALGGLAFYYQNAEMTFSDLAFWREYVGILESISEATYLDNLLSELDNEIKQNLDIIYSEFPDFDFSKKIFDQNQRYIRTVLNPKKAMHAYFHQSTNNQVKLELGNIQSLPVEVLSVSYMDTLLFYPRQETILLGKQPSDLVDYQDITFSFPDGFDWSDSMVSYLKVNYRLLGSSQIRQDTVFPWSHLSENFSDNDFVRKQPNVDIFDFLVINDTTQEILIKPGTWNLDQDLIVPKGYRVIAGEGTQLNLRNSAKILSYSPIEFVGSEDDPILIQSMDSSGQGMVVMSANEKSILEFVTFDDLANPSQSSWELTGAITFYESPVSISHSQFVDIRAEDALNIVRSDFTLVESSFSNTTSDAFDADFAKGQISKSFFTSIGNDAIDVSGSMVDIQDVFVNGSGDKGLSVGENSQVTIDHIDIQNAEIGIASKDLSKVTAKEVNISTGEIGLAAYQKKSEFGAASLTVEGLKIVQVSLPYLVEAESRLIVDNLPVASSTENVKEIISALE